MGLTESIGQRFAADDALHEAGVDITGIDAGELEVVRRLVARSIDRGWSPETLAQRLQPTLGLGPRYTQAVDSYRQGLLDKEVPPGKADRMAKEYAGRLKQHRALTVAKTEQQRSIAKGQIESWRRLQKAGQIGNRAVRVFKAHKDCCKDICKQHNGKRISLSDDTRLVPPLHPNCRCTIELSDRTVTKGSDMNIAKYSTRELAGRGKKLAGFRRPSAKPVIRHPHFGLKHVRTQEGADHFGVPIGSPIHADHEDHGPKLSQAEVHSRMQRALHIRERQLARVARHPVHEGPPPPLLHVPDRPIPPDILQESTRFAAPVDAPAHDPKLKEALRIVHDIRAGRADVRAFDPSYDADGNELSATAQKFNDLYPVDNTFPPPGNTWTSWYMDMEGNLRPVESHGSAAEDALDVIHGDPTEDFIDATGYMRVGYLPLPGSTDSDPMGDMYVEFTQDGVTYAQLQRVLDMVNGKHADTTASISDIDSESPWLLQITPGEITDVDELAKQIEHYQHEALDDTTLIPPRAESKAATQPSAPAKKKLHPYAQAFYDIDYLIPATAENLVDIDFLSKADRSGGWWEIYMDTEGKMFLFPYGITHSDTARNAGAYSIEDFIRNTGFVRLGNYGSQSTNPEVYGTMYGPPNPVQQKVIAHMAEVKNKNDATPAFIIEDASPDRYLFMLPRAAKPDDVMAEFKDMEANSSVNLPVGGISKLARRVRSAAGIRRFRKPIGTMLPHGDEYKVYVEAAPDNEAMRNGKTNVHGVLVRANTPVDAQLIASEMVAARGSIPTKTRVLSSTRPRVGGPANADPTKGPISSRFVTPTILRQYGFPTREYEILHDGTPKMLYDGHDFHDSLREAVSAGFVKYDSDIPRPTPNNKIKLTPEEIAADLAYINQHMLRREPVAKRKVRTPEGSKRYGLPIGTTITAAMEQRIRRIDRQLVRDKQRSVDRHHPEQGTVPRWQAARKAQKARRTTMMERANAKKAKGKIDVGGDDSLTKYAPNGQLTPERQKLHDQIVSKLLAGQKKSADPQIIFMGGGPASGKSTALGEGHIGAKIDADEIKGMLPEYQEGVKKGDPNAANYVHEESSMLAKRVQTEAVDNGFDITLDGTGDSDINKLRAKVESARSHGYKVKGAYVTVDTEEAVRRAEKRGKETGRVVPPVVVREVHKAVTKTFLKALDEDLFDEVELWDTNGSQPVLIGQKPEGGTWQVHDEAAWKAFQDKANPQPTKSAKHVAMQKDDQPPAEEDNAGEIAIRMLQAAAGGGDFPDGIEHTPDNDALWEQIVNEVKEITDAGQVVDVPFDYTLEPDDDEGPNDEPEPQAEAATEDTKRLTKPKSPFSKSEPVMTPGRDGMPYSGVTLLRRRRKRRRKVEKSIRGFMHAFPTEGTHTLHQLERGRREYKRKPKGHGGGQFATGATVQSWFDKLHTYPKIKPYKVRKGGFFVDTNGDIYDVQFHIPAVSEITGDTMSVGRFLQQSGIVRLRATGRMLDVSFVKPMTPAQMARIAKEAGTRVVITNVGDEDGFEGTEAEVLAELKRQSMSLKGSKKMPDVYKNRYH